MPSHNNLSIHFRAFKNPVDLVLVLIGIGIVFILLLAVMSFAFFKFLVSKFLSCTFKSFRLVSANKNNTTYCTNIALTSWTRMCL